MAIVIIRQDGKIKEWKEALSDAAPNIPIYSYLEKHPKQAIEMALVWKHPPGALRAYKNLKCISSSGAGVDFIFKDKGAPLHLPITRVVDLMLAKDMTEHVVGVILAFLKNFYTYTIDQAKRVWKPLPYKRIGDLTIGIMGMGALGIVMAKDLNHFGFSVQGWSNSKKNVEGVKSFVGQPELSDFLGTTQILICLLPLTENTAGILNKVLFQQLPKGAFVINVARGGHLVDEDLLEMLYNGHLSGAGLDVHHEEPLPVSHPFWAHPKIHMTPHCASVSDTQSVVPQILENYRRLHAGNPLLNLVSKERGY